MSCGSSTSGTLSTPTTAPLTGVARSLSPRPDNIILIEHAGHPDFVKLLDFGIAKLNEHIGSDNETKAGILLGTAGYIAPEQMLGGQTDARSDIYAAGVVLYQMITGQKPFVAGS